MVAGRCRSHHGDVEDVAPRLQPAGREEPSPARSRHGGGRGRSGPAADPERRPIPRRRTPRRCARRTTSRAATRRSVGASPRRSAFGSHSDPRPPTTCSSGAGPASHDVLVTIGSPAQASSSVVTVPSVVNSIRSNGSRSSICDTSMVRAGIIVLCHGHGVPLQWSSAVTTDVEWSRFGGDCQTRERTSGSPESAGAEEPGTSRASTRWGSGVRNVYRSPLTLPRTATAPGPMYRTATGAGLRARCTDHPGPG